MKQSKFLWGSLGILFICFWLAYDFLIITKFPSYPWWQRYWNDIDSSFPAAILGLINGGDLSMLALHPAATIFSLHGVVYKIFSFFSKDYYLFTHIHQINDMYVAVEVLNKAVLISKWISLLTSFLFVIVLYVMFYEILGSLLLSFLFTFYVCTTSAVFLFSHSIRPELLNLTFYLAGAYFLVLILKKTVLSFADWNKYIFAASVMWGLSVLTKIQIGPAIALSAGFFMIMMFYKNKKTPVIKFSDKNLKINLILAIVNLCIFPWWALRKTNFMTGQYLKGLNVYMQQATKNPYFPDSFVFDVLKYLVVLFLGALVLMFFRKKKNQGGINSYLLGISYFINSIVLSFVLCVYALYLPISANSILYQDNIQNMLYVFISNIYNGSFLSHCKEVDFSRIHEVISYLQEGNFLNINLFYLVSALFVWCVFRILTAQKEKKLVYGLSLFLIFIGAVMDLFALMRSNPKMSYYTHYHLTFYALAFAVWISAHVKGQNVKSSKFFLIVVILFSAHLLWKCQQLVFLRLPPGGLAFNEEFKKCAHYGMPYWNTVNRNLLYTDDVQTMKQKGTNFSWGLNQKELTQQINRFISQKGRYQNEQYKELGVNDAILEYIKYLHTAVYTYYAYINLANGAKIQGQFGFAKQIYEKAMWIFLSFPEAYAGLTETAFLQKDYKEGWRNLMLAERYGFKVDPSFIQKFSIPNQKKYWRYHQMPPAEAK